MTLRDAYLLAGPTASGKSAIAAVLARRLGARILSADSMLVYRGMDIGTAKPPREEIEEFGMGGVDIVTPAEEFSSGAWLRAAALAIGYREGDDRERIFVRTCQLAKRQDTWFRHQATPLYVEPDPEAVWALWRARGPWKVCFGPAARQAHPS